MCLLVKSSCPHNQSRWRVGDNHAETEIEKKNQAHVIVYLICDNTIHDEPPAKGLIILPGRWAPASMRRMIVGRTLSARLFCTAC